MENQSIKHSIQLIDQMINQSINTSIKQSIISKSINQSNYCPILWVFLHVHTSGSGHLKNWGREVGDVSCGDNKFWVNPSNTHRFWSIVFSVYKWLNFATFLDFSSFLDFSVFLLFDIVGGILILLPSPLLPLFAVHTPHPHPQRWLQSQILINTLEEFIRYFMTNDH